MLRVRCSPLLLSRGITPMVKTITERGALFVEQLCWHVMNSSRWILPTSRTITGVPTRLAWIR